MQAIAKPRSPFVLTLIWLLVTVLAAGGGWMIWQRAQQGVVLETPDEALLALQPYLAGEKLHVATASGFWVEEHPQARALIQHGEAVGRKQEIDLCEQRKLTVERPMQIYPIALDEVSEYFSAGSPKLKNPVGISSALAQGMPRLVVSGDATANWQPLSLAVSGEGKSWKLLGDAVVNGKVSLVKQAWLLWQSDSKQTAQADTRFDRAVRIERRMAGACQHGQPTAGKLEFTLFRAVTKTTGVFAKRAAQLVVFPMAGGVHQARLMPGEQVFPQNKPASVEDKALFDAALAQGLVRLNTAGNIEIAPADLTAAWQSGLSVPQWDQVPHDELTRRLLKRLYTKADGAIVRSRIAQFNQSRWWVAARIRTTGSMPQTSLADLKLWNAAVDGMDTPLSTDMPDVVARLFDAPPVGWSDWRRVATWPASVNDKTRVSLSLPSGVAGRVEVLVMGKVTGISGAAILAQRDACSGTGCPVSDLLQQLEIKITQPGKVTIEIKPDARFSVLDPSVSGFRHIRIKDKQLVWVQPPLHVAVPLDASKVNLVAQNGLPLVVAGMPTKEAGELGLLPVVGVSAEQGNALTAMLGRTGIVKNGQVSGKLSIDPALQSLSQQVLDCVARRGLRWNAAAGQCGKEQLVSAERVAGEDAGRRSALVILDAGNGDVLVSAGSPGLQSGVSPQDLIDFDRFNQARSPLSVIGWHHDGGVEHVPGSGFKLVTSLGLELAAKQSKSLDSLLSGLPTGRIDAYAAGRGYNFLMSGGCYPLPCNGKLADGAVPIDNYKHHRPMDYAADGGFGLRQALSASLNTWFAWMTEMNDATLLGRPAGGKPDVRPLGDDALDGLRPLSVMAQRLGFGRATRLDGGLLPTDYPWHADDVLAATPSTFDPMQNRHEIRKQSIGSRMQVTPLQMAVVAASIGEGKVVSPRLLLELDGRAAATTPAVELGVRLDRIRAGMKDVVEHGTAQSAFTSPALKMLRSGVYAKTGSAENQAVQGNVSWFVGYVEPDTLPGEHRRLAFAVYISRSPITGGAHAAPVMAGVLESLAQRGVIGK